MWIRLQEPARIVGSDLSHELPFDQTEVEATVASFDDQAAPRPGRGGRVDGVLVLLG